MKLFLYGCSEQAVSALTKTMGRHNPPTEVIVGLADCDLHSMLHEEMPTHLLACNASLLARARATIAELNLKISVQPLRVDPSARGQDD